MFGPNHWVKQLKKNQKYQYEISQVRLQRLLSYFTKPTLNVDMQTARKNSTESSVCLLETLDHNIIGSDAGFWGPFGWRKYIYADHTASGKALKCIEDFIEQQVLPHYANTHTTASHTSLQTTTFRNEAREIIKQSVGGLENDEVIFCGSGATSAVHKLVHAISYPKTRKLIVFIGPFEHHSNILPWREAASKIVQVPMSSSTGQVDIAFLRDSLQRLCDKDKKKKKNQLIIGCFSAGSNITGTVTDDVEITKLLHKFGALAFWDYAAAAPHIKIQMNPQCQSRFNEYSYHAEDACLAFKDAIFFSGHKFLGGPQTPGVLVVKRHVLQNPVPHAMGGGTVLFTTRKRHHYIEEKHEREEGGTPDIVGSIRLGLVFRLRNKIGIESITRKEATFCRQVLASWSNIPEIHILGLSDNARLPIVSFMIRHLESGYFMHHNFVVALLNDLFGIQCRGGCMCAGPYAQALLNIDDKLASFYETSLKNERNCGGIVKPGFVRASFSFHSTQEEVSFLSEAVQLVAKNGWKLLPFYQIDWKTASFTFNTSFYHGAPLSSLSMFDEFVTSAPSINKMSINSINDPDQLPVSEILRNAKMLLTSSSVILQAVSPDNLRATFSDTFCKPLQKKSDVEKLRWFMFPFESLIFQQLGSIPTLLKSPKPFLPLILEENKYFHTWRHGFQPCSMESIPSQLYRIWKKQDPRSMETRNKKICKPRGSCEFYPKKILICGSNNVCNYDYLI